MVIVMNDDRISDVEAYLPLARAFVEDSLQHEKGCLAMEVTTDPKTPGRVVYFSKWESEEDFRATVGGAIFNKHIPQMGKFFLGSEDSIFYI
jgi:quinol monooxygenase YgiN